MDANLSKLMGLFNDPALTTGFPNINDPAKKHQISTRIFKVLRDQDAIIKEDGVNKFSPYFKFDENFAERIVRDAQDLKRFQDASDATRKRFENALLSPDAYPFDLDDWWQMVGYAEKRNAKRALEGLNLGKKEVLFATDGEKSDGNEVLMGRPSECVRMSRRAFSHFCMAAQTYMGHVVRDLFYEVYDDFQGMKKEAAETNEVLHESILFELELKRFKSIIGAAASHAKILTNNLAMDNKDERTGNLFTTRVADPGETMEEIKTGIKDAIANFSKHLGA